MLDIEYHAFSYDQAALRTLLSIRLSVWPAGRPAVTSFWQYSSHQIILKFSLPLTDVMFMQKVKVKGQGHRGQDPT